MVMMNPVQAREFFHLVFLRALARSISPSTFALKGGANLRFFFGSIRYSEDMDIDVSGIAVHTLREKVMSVLGSSGLLDTLRTSGIEDLRLPDMARAKQTETVQRFKIGLLTAAGEDLATKVEFSRRSMDEGIRAEPVSPEVLASYRMPPMIIPHYVARTAALQKVRALASRARPQARDVFDLYLLSSQPEILEAELGQELSANAVLRARETIYSVAYQQYRDTVLDFLRAEDRTAYDSPQIWDEIRLRALAVIGEGALDDQ
jgi:predicted nucleotidyltransferase component of viral defense system